MPNPDEPLDLEGPKLQKPPTGLFLLAGIFITIITLIAIAISTGTTFPSDPTPPLEETPAASPAPVLGADATSCMDKSGPELTNCCEAWVQAEGIVIPACEGTWEPLDVGCGWNCAVE